MQDLKVRGLVFLYTKFFLIERLSNHEYNEFISSLPEHLKVLMEKEILETQAYPLDFHLELDRYIYEKFSKDPEIISKLGEYVIKNAAEGPFKILFETINLKTYFSQVGAFTFKHFYSFGDFQIKEISMNDRKIVVHLGGIPFKDFLFEEGIKGALKAAAEIKGLKNVNVKITKRVTEGSDYIEYVITWG